MRARFGLSLAGVAFVIITATTACGAETGARHGAISIVAAENQYGDVASQIGGRYVTVTSVESNPNVDPHTYEVSPSVAQAVSGANIVIENGIGYDSFISKVESSTPNSHRVTIDVQSLLGLADTTPNPHLWYSPRTMPIVARVLAGDLSRLQPAHRTYFRQNSTRFAASLRPISQAIAEFRAVYPDTPVATTEPVADYLLQALGCHNLTPFSFQSDVMNGIEPSPEDVKTESDLFSVHRVKVFVYNRQVTDSLTESFVSAAHGAHLPVVGVYETMPTPGFTYQTWMLAEVKAIRRAVADGVSTNKL